MYVHMYMDVYVSVYVYIYIKLERTQLNAQIMSGEKVNRRKSEGEISVKQEYLEILWRRLDLS